MRKGLKYFLLVISILAIVYLFKVLIFLRTEVVCADVRNSSSIKGLKVVRYTYKYHGKIYNGSFNSSAGISMRPDVYNNKECFEIEVSKLIPSMSRVKIKKNTNKKINS